MVSYNLTVQKMILYILTIPVILFPFITIFLGIYVYYEKAIIIIAIPYLMFTALAILLFYSESEYKRKFTGLTMALWEPWSTVNIEKVYDIAMKFTIFWAIICILFSIYFNFIISDIFTRIYAIIFLIIDSNILIYFIVQSFLIVNGGKLNYKLPPNLPFKYGLIYDLKERLLREFNKIETHYKQDEDLPSSIHLDKLGIDIDFYYYGDYDLTLSIKSAAKEEDVLKIIRIIDSLTSKSSKHSIIYEKKQQRYIFRRMKSRKVQQKPGRTKRPEIPNWMIDGLEFFYVYDNARSV